MTPPRIALTSLCLALAAAALTSSAVAAPGPTRGGFSGAVCVDDDGPDDAAAFDHFQGSSVVAGPLGTVDHVATAFDGLTQGDSIAVGQEAQINGVLTRPFGTILVGTVDAETNTDAFAALFDNEGEIWRTTVGEEGDEVATDIAVEGDLAYLVGSSDDALAVSVLDANDGTVLDDRTWGVAGDRGLTSVDVLDDGDIVVGGEGILARLDGGTLETVWEWYTEEAPIDAVTALVVDDDVVYATGVLPGDGGQFVAGVGADGAQVFRRDQGETEGTAIPYAIAATPDGPVVVGSVDGRIGTTTGEAGQLDGYVQARGATGTVRWTTRFGTPGSTDAITGVGSTGRSVTVAGTTDLSEDCSAFLATVDEFRVEVQARTKSGFGDKTYLRVDRGSYAEARIRVGNRGRAADAVAVSLCKPTRGLTFTVRQGQKNVTRQVLAGTYRTPRLAAGATVTLTLGVRAGKSAPLRELFCLVKAASLSAAGATDQTPITIVTRKPPKN